MIKDSNQDENAMMTNLKIRCADQNCIDFTKNFLLIFTSLVELIAYRYSLIIRFLPFHGSLKHIFFIRHVSDFELNV